MRFNFVRVARLVFLFWFGVIAGGCTRQYFHEAPSPAKPIQYELKNWAPQEYWTGIVFNGAKIGFTHFGMKPSLKYPGLYEIQAQAAFALHFLGLEKKISLRSFDIVNEDLTLVSFEYEHNLDGNVLKQSGETQAGHLDVDIQTANQTTHQQFLLPEKLYPTSILALYPVVHGLHAGTEYRYAVYDGETQKIEQVQQFIEAYEQSQVFAGAAHKIRTSLYGNESQTWINDAGQPVFELALDGVMISALEDEETAKKYLALASLNKQEVLLGFSMVKTTPPIPDPRNLVFLKVELSGLDNLDALPQNGMQHCMKKGQSQVCEIHSPDINAMEEKSSEQYGKDANLAPYLRSSGVVQSYDPQIRTIAKEITRGEEQPLQKIQKILAWMNTHIRKEPVDVFSAVDVMRTRRAECQGHAYLYAAFARSLGIPTRVVNGLAHSEALPGFLYHSWAESYVGGDWLPIDPTFGQLSVDATHIKLLEGEQIADLMPLMSWVGKISVHIDALEHRAP